MKILLLESPALWDISADAFEGRLLRDQFRLVGVEVTYQAVTSKTELFDLTAKLIDRHDVIHLSGHGSKEALGFTDGSSMAWSDAALFARTISADMARLIVFSTCHSSSLNMNEAQSLSERIVREIAGIDGMPRCVLTLWDRVPLADAILTWALFYRHLRHLTPAGKDCFAPELSARTIHRALCRVKGAGLPVKVCAHYRYDRYDQFRSISPWGLAGDGERNADIIDGGEVPPELT